MNNTNNMFSIVDMAFSTPELKEEHGMTIADHKLICKVLDAHTQTIKLDSEQENREFKEKLISDALEVIRTELRPVKESILKIEKKVDALGKDLRSVKRIQKEHSLRLDQLESNFNIIFKEHIENHKKKSIQL